MLRGYIQYKGEFGPYWAQIFEVAREDHVNSSENPSPHSSVCFIDLNLFPFLKLLNLL